MNQKPIEVTIRKSILLAAEQAVLSDRNNTYGPPEESFRITAQMWSAILGRMVTPAEVALCLAALKIARLSANPCHVDSWVDLAGYAACGGEVACSSE